MTDASITVRVAGFGTMSGGALERDARTQAQCTVCGQPAEAVASIGAHELACAGCLRARLDSLSVARFRLREGQSDRAGSPWGKVSG